MKEYKRMESLVESLSQKGNPTEEAYKAKVEEEHYLKYYLKMNEIKHKKLGKRIYGNIVVDDTQEGLERKEDKNRVLPQIKTFRGAQGTYQLETQLVDGTDTHGRSDIYLAREKGNGRIYVIKFPYHDPKECANETAIIEYLQGNDVVIFKDKNVPETSPYHTLEHMGFPYVKVEDPDNVTDSDIPFIVMECMPGDSLYKFAIKSENPYAFSNLPDSEKELVYKDPSKRKPSIKLDLRSYLQLSRRMVAIVTSVHNEGIVHLDLKPGNFLMTGELLDTLRNLSASPKRLETSLQGLKLCDFDIAGCLPGCALELEKIVYDPSSFPYTRGYVSPEYEKDRDNPTCEMDIFSLGKTLIQMYQAVSSSQNEKLTSQQRYNLELSMNEMINENTKLRRHLNSVFEDFSDLIESIPKIEI